MSGYHLRVPLRDGLTTVRAARPEADELLDFSIWRAPAAGQTLEVETEDREYGLMILSGLVDLGTDEDSFEGLGGRSSVFSGTATGVWVPPNQACRLLARSRCEVALCSAESDAEGSIHVVAPDQVIVKTVGHANWARDVHTVLGPQVEAAQRLVVGETFNLPGNWSSYPPHRHIEDDYPFEVRMEEVYHYRVNPPGGFGIQCLYNDGLDLDDAYVVRDGDTVAIPAAYHPVAAAPGYQVYYLWMLAAYTDRRLTPRDDPAHAWVHAAGQMARGLGS